MHVQCVYTHITSLMFSALLSVHLSGSSSSLLFFFISTGMYISLLLIAPIIFAFAILSFFSSSFSHCLFLLSHHNRSLPVTPSGLSFCLSLSGSPYVLPLSLFLSPLSLSSHLLILLWQWSEWVYRDGWREIESVWGGGLICHLDRGEGGWMAAEKGEEEGWRGYSCYGDEIFFVLGCQGNFGRTLDTATITTPTPDTWL